MAGCQHHFPGAKPGGDPAAPYPRLGHGAQHGCLPARPAIWAPEMSRSRVNISIWGLALLPWKLIDFLLAFWWEETFWESPPASRVNACEAKRRQERREGSPITHSTDAARRAPGIHEITSWFCRIKEQFGCIKEAL